MNLPEEKKLTVAVAGASGFVGTALIRKLSLHQRVIALSRSKKNESHALPNVEWRACDLFSMLDAESALAGVDVAYYLVHAMMPSARLTQGGFENLDLIAADNFARAAKKQGVKQIIYLGGLIPDVKTLSPHLKSRLEVENTLKARGVRFTGLRAGLIVGAEGSSFQMLYRLVKRLPIMLCPKWTNTDTQPIALRDVVDLLYYCLDRDSVAGQSYDIGGPDVVTYRRMIMLLAKLMGVHRRIFNVRVFSPGFSRLWVSLVTGAPRQLVKPLVQSLRHKMVAQDLRLQVQANLPGMPLEEALAETLIQVSAIQNYVPVAFRGGSKNKTERDVRSVQRFSLPAGKNAKWVGDEYMAWLPGHFFPVRIVTENKMISFRLALFPKALLILKFAEERSSNDRSLFYIRGGILAKIQGRGRFEFRETWDGKNILAAVHEFRPRLPWYFYAFTQAPLHRLVMWRFGRYLKKR